MHKASHSLQGLWLEFIRWLMAFVPKFISNSLDLTPSASNLFLVRRRNAPVSGRLLFVYLIVRSIMKNHPDVFQAVKEVIRCYYRLEPHHWPWWKCSLRAMLKTPLLFRLPNSKFRTFRGHSWLFTFCFLLKRKVSSLQGESRPTQQTHLTVNRSTANLTTK